MGGKRMKEKRSIPAKFKIREKALGRAGEIAPWPLQGSGKVKWSGSQITLLWQKFSETWLDLPLAILSNDTYIEKQIFWSAKLSHSNKWNYVLKMYLLGCITCFFSKEFLFYFEKYLLLKCNHGKVSKWPNLANSEREKKNNVQGVTDMRENSAH